MGDACRMCGGNGYRWNGERRVPCYACAGTGGTVLPVDQRPRPGELKAPADPIKTRTR